MSSARITSRPTGDDFPNSGPDGLLGGLSKKLCGAENYLGGQSIHF